MRRPWIAMLFVAVACSAQQSFESASETPAATPSAVATAQPSTQLLVRSDPIPTEMPPDCDRWGMRFDTTSLPSVPVTRAEVLERTDPSGRDRPTPIAVVLARATTDASDIRGQPLMGRPVWVVYRTGMLNNLPSGGPARAQTPRPNYMWTASITMFDALTGESLLGLVCGIVRVP